eukprot:gb/GFBE01054906.1/.p1 GENE.gb/GFBE01054906.1/~~gb/GFBE01054906.1/.p1  ORF type:complete len:377 (+),score=47.53 gb/GFBE01054906.1/:1-1131(+)
MALRQLLGFCAAALASAELGNFTQRLREPRDELACAHADGLLVCGGGRRKGDQSASDAVDVFDLQRQGERVPTSPDRLSAPRAFDGGQNVAASCRGKVFIAGGAGKSGKSAVVDVFDAATRTWSNLTLSRPRSFLAVTAFEHAGLVLFGGGEEAEDEWHPENSKDTRIVDVWSVIESRWLAPMQLGVPRKKLTATTVLDRYAIFAGGFLSNNGSEGYRADMDVYDIQTNQWKRSLTLSQGRMRLAAASVGPCAVFGGGEVNVSAGDATGLVDQFCVVGDSSWEHSVAELSVRRYELAAASYGGLAYFAGGNIGVGGTDARGAYRVDVVDPIAGVWRKLELAEPKVRLAAAAGNGYVCFAGGDSVECIADASHEILV